MQTNSDIKKAISADRSRTNILKGLEQPTLAFLCKIMPKWVSPNILTFIGFLGSLTISLGFYLAKQDNVFLYISIFGFAIQWFGDSLDGRIAYFRNTPRKWYGFSLDMSMDWISSVIIGIGLYYYLPLPFRILALTYLALYGWTMLLALLKYQITGVYAIDAGLVGPTELRVAVCTFLFFGTIWVHTITVFTIIINVALFIVNITDLRKVLSLGNERDRNEKSESATT